MGINASQTIVKCYSINLMMIMSIESHEILLVHPEISVVCSSFSRTINKLRWSLSSKQNFTIGGGEWVLTLEEEIKFLHERGIELLTTLPTDTQPALLHYTRSVSEEPEKQLFKFTTVLAPLEQWIGLCIRLTENLIWALSTRGVSRPTLLRRL